MDISLVAFCEQIAAYPLLIVILVLVIAVTIVSGATDAPNAIATAVSTRCLKPTTALALAAVFNFIGLIGISCVSTAVGNTMFKMVNFSGDTHLALMALIAGMIASIIWGLFCWFGGIPASKSHSIIAGISGGAIAMNGLDGIVIVEWVKVLYGMAVSLFAGFVFGWLIVKCIERLFKYADRHKSNRLCTIVQDICAAVLAALHGSQDGQKFMSIAILGIALVLGVEDSKGVVFPVWLMLICSLAMSLGTLIGGKRIIKSVAMDMVKLEKYQGVSSSISSALTLIITTFAGMPASTSHCNTSAIMGVGASKNPRKVKWDIAGNMVKAWLLTFPCCGLAGFVLAKVFMLF